MACWMEPDFPPIRQIVGNLRAADREELFATRYPSLTREEEEDRLASDVATRWCSALGVSRVVGVEENGERVPVAAFGALPLWPGVWSAWMFATDRFPQVGLTVTRFIKRQLIPYVQYQGAHRCEARSSASHVWAHKWLRSLGATQEAVLKRYGRGGEDFIVFRWDRR